MKDLWRGKEGRKKGREWCKGEMEGEIERERVKGGKRKRGTEEGNEEEKRGV